MEYSEQARLAARQAILKTLTYSDIFDFPLRIDELWEYLVSDIFLSREDFGRSLDKLLTDGQVNYLDGYYCLGGRVKIIRKRKENLSEVGKKMEIAKKAANYLSYIPTIQFIGLSGGLAMYDVEEQDDIDFFIITKRKTLFMTRIWILGLLQLLRLRRTRRDKNPKDKICVNFMLDTDKLNFPKDKRDIYIAHEIVQIKPFFERDDMYKIFLKSNKWVKTFFPNTKSQNFYDLQKHIGLHVNFIKAVFYYIYPLASLVKWAQIKYIRRHQTIENVSEGVLAFHPNDYRVQTLTKMNLKLRQLGLLTNF